MAGFRTLWSDVALGVGRGVGVSVAVGVDVAVLVSVNVVVTVGVLFAIRLGMAGLLRPNHKKAPMTKINIPAKIPIGIRLFLAFGISV